MSLNTYPCTRAEIAFVYNVSVRTLHRWFKRYDLDYPRNRLIPNEWLHVQDVLGPPPLLDQLEYYRKENNKVASIHHFTQNLKTKKL